MMLGLEDNPPFWGVPRQNKTHPNEATSTYSEKRRKSTPPISVQLIFSTIKGIVPRFALEKRDKGSTRIQTTDMSRPVLDFGNTCPGIRVSRSWVAFSAMSQSPCVTKLYGWPPPQLQVVPTQVVHLAPTEAAWRLLFQTLYLTPIWGVRLDTKQRHLFCDPVHDGTG